MSNSKTSGSGWGRFEPGDRIANPAQLTAGDLLTDYCRQFNARNIVRVTQVFADRFYGRFVNPDDPSKPRLWGDEEFCIWDFQIWGDGTILKHDLQRAIPQKSRRPTAQHEEDA